MQPQTSPNDDWQTPSEQPSKAPYAAPIQDENAQQVTPVVTMQGGESTAPVAATANPSQPQSATDEPVRWQAQEYISHERGTIWFIVFGLAVVALMAAAIFLMNSITFAILIPVMAVALIVYLRRAPRTIDYTLSRQGLHINDQLYSFSEFKGFGVIRDGREYSVMLIPVKRFRQGVMVYFPEESGEAIVDMLGARLPMLELHLDIVDRLIRKLRM